MCADNGFRRARRAEHKEQRRNDLLEAARTLATENGVRGLTLTAVAEAAGLHVSAVRRYFESPESVLLTIAEHEWLHWSHTMLDRLTGHANVSSDELCRILTETLAAQPLFCDLQTHVTLDLERGVTYERVRDYKLTALSSLTAVAIAITDTTSLIEEQAYDLLAGALSLAAPLWQATHPSATLQRLYIAEPDLARIRMEFEPTLNRLLTAMCSGLTRQTPTAQ